MKGFLDLHLVLLLLPDMEWTLLRVLKLQCMVGEQQKITKHVQLKCLYLQLKAAGPVHMLLMSLGILMVSMWCLNDSTVGWLRNSGGSKFQVTMVLGRNEYLYASTLVLICRMLWAQDPLVLVVLIWMYWWSGTSTRLFRIL